MNTHDIDIELPAEFRSGNCIPVERATITRERMTEILQDAIEADRQYHDRVLAHEWIRSALRLSEDAPYRFDFYAQEIEKLMAVRQQGGEPVAWESKTPVFRKFVTDSTYQRFSTETKKWYKPYKCSSCEAPQPAEMEDPNTSPLSGKGPFKTASELIDSINEPVKVPSDDDIEQLAKQFGFHRVPGTIELARDVLARSGQSAPNFGEEE